MSVCLLVFGSYMDRWRGDCFSGAAFDDGCEPSLQYAGCAAAGRMRDVNHTRPSRSIIGLWMLVWPSHAGSLPQYADCPFGSEVEDSVSGSRHGCSICVAMCLTGFQHRDLVGASPGPPADLAVGADRGLVL